MFAEEQAPNWICSDTFDGMPLWELSFLPGGELRLFVIDGRQFFWVPPLPTQKKFWSLPPLERTQTYGSHLGKKFCPPSATHRKFCPPFDPMKKTLTTL